MSRGPQAPLRALALVMLAASCSSGRQPPARPNLLLVTFDTLRADHCSAYGYARDTTPVLARLAREGALVEQAYAPMPHTGPSHATMFTALHPLGHGYLRNGQVLGEEHVTLAERLRASGYRTSAAVASFVLKPAFGFAQGFGSFDAPFQSGALGAAGGRFNRRADATTDAALAWLASRQRDRPYFLWVHYFDPHGPYAPPAPYDSRYPSGAEGSLERIVAGYDGEIRFADEHLGRLIAAVDAEGPERTVVAVTADHGEGLMQHGHMDHGLQLYEEAVRVPLVLRAPGLIPPGVRISGPVELVDLAPTLLDLVGVAWSDSPAQGLSIAAALRGASGVPGRDRRRPVFLQRRPYSVSSVDGVPVAGEKLGLREGRWKYSEAPEEGTRELYDLDVDPGETVNVAAAHPDDARRLSGTLAAWRKRYDGAPRAAEDTSPEASEGLRALGYVR